MLLPRYRGSRFCWSKSRLAAQYFTKKRKKLLMVHLRERSRTFSPGIAIVARSDSLSEIISGENIAFRHWLLSLSGDDGMMPDKNGQNCRLTKEYFLTSFACGRADAGEPAFS
jgi:hypothetical protein